MRRHAQHKQGAGRSSFAMTERVAMTVTTHGAVAGIGYRPPRVAACSAVAGMGIALVADPPRLMQW